MDLIEGKKVGKEVFYATSSKGIALIERFRDVRERCWLAGIKGDIADGRMLSETARRLRLLSGVYDQAARAASSL
ncbi:MAG: transcriptional regulator [Noviherbaspirillum sp.]|jgi:predicted MarR family transcription regulator|nr:transcriptional regulator [Noviherbaspirillum sp.]MDB5795897.1 transcriptional regulator [Noviherbaspirillum sp.]